MGDLLVYGTAGVAYANFSGFDGLADIDVSDPGLVAGLGVDYRVSENWVAGAEYMFHRFSDFGPTGDDVDLNTVHLRVSYQF
jgi:opacity protein-like surface antigen